MVCTPITLVLTLQVLSVDGIVCMACQTADFFYWSCAAAFFCQGEISDAKKSDTRAGISTAPASFRDDAVSMLISSIAFLS